jgi:AcrR family transcriptional regulator
MGFIMGIRERKEREKERRRQQILVAAKRVFSSKGLDGATIDDIAGEAELSAGTLYLYFKSKDELCASLAIRLLQYFVVRIDHLVKEAQLNAGDKIVALKHALFDIYEFDPQLFKRLILLNSRELFYNVDPALTAEIEKLRCVALEKITSIFKIGVKKGIYICKQPDEMAEIIWAMFCGIVLWHEDSLSSGRKSPHLEKIMNRAFQIFERGALA